MNHAQTVARVRELVQGRLNPHAIASLQLHESLLIREGIYCGRRFHCPDSGHSAVWFAEHQRIDVFDGDGQALGAIELEDPEMSTPRAA